MLLERERERERGGGRWERLAMEASLVGLRAASNTHSGLACKRRHRRVTITIRTITLLAFHQSLEILSLLNYERKIYSYVYHYQTEGLFL